MHDTISVILMISGVGAGLTLVSRPFSEIRMLVLTLTLATVVVVFFAGALGYYADQLTQAWRWQQYLSGG